MIGSGLLLIGCESGASDFKPITELNTANEETLLRKHCVKSFRHNASPLARSKKNLLRQQKCFGKSSETFFVARTQKMAPQQTFPVRASGKH